MGGTGTKREESRSLSGEIAGTDKNASDGHCRAIP